MLGTSASSIAALMLVVYTAATRRQAARCTWFKFKAHLHMMSHFYCQLGEGQDSSFGEHLHC